jgi:hypothetical protein
MPDETELHQAEAVFLFQAKWFSTKPTIEALNGTELDRPTLIVNEGAPSRTAGTGIGTATGTCPVRKVDRKLGKTRFT